jgi:hypothetical protein
LHLIPSIENFSTTQTLQIINDLGTFKYNSEEEDIELKDLPFSQGIAQMKEDTFYEGQFKNK